MKVCNEKKQHTCLNCRRKLLSEQTTHTHTPRGLRSDDMLKVTFALKILSFSLFSQPPLFKSPTLSRVFGSTRFCLPQLSTLTPPRKSRRLQPYTSNHGLCEPLRSGFRAATALMEITDDALAAAADSDRWFNLLELPAAFAHHLPHPSPAPIWPFWRLYDGSKFSGSSACPFFPISDQIHRQIHLLSLQNQLQTVCLRPPRGFPRQGGSSPEL